MRGLSIMKKSRNLTKPQLLVVWGLCFLMLFNLFVYQSVLRTDMIKVESKEGKVLLSDSFFDSIIELEGEWKYYSNRLAEDKRESDVEELRRIPEYKKGNDLEDFYRFGTYELVVTGLKPNQAVGFFIQDEVSAYRLLVNHREIMKNGLVGEDESSSIPEWRPTTMVAYADQNGELLIQMEISNFHYSDGLFWNSIKIGEPKQVLRYHMNRLILESILAICFAMIGLFFVVLHFYRKNNRILFYFAAYNLLEAVRVGLTSIRPVSHFFDGLNWNFLVRSEYLAGYLLLPVLILFVLELVENKRINIIKRVFRIIALLTFIFVVFSKHTTYTSILFPYFGVAFVCAFLAIVYVLKFYNRNRFNEVILIVSFINVLIGIGKELVGDLVSWMPVVILNVTIALSIILLYQFYRHIRTTEVLAVKASIDPLTGLYNRQFLDEYEPVFERRVEETPQYILFLDLDGFKAVNDTYGHRAGDHVLQVIGQRIRKNIRKEDVVCRYGGDEFVLILHTKSEDEIEEIASRLIMSLSSPVVEEDKHYQIGVSIGVTICEKISSYTLQDYIRRSDEAMYKAKLQGGNRFHLEEVRV